VETVEKYLEPCTRYFKEAPDEDLQKRSRFLSEAAVRRCSSIAFANLSGLILQILLHRVLKMTFENTMQQGARRQIAKFVRYSQASMASF
jgi:hypothetical protein